MDGENKGKPYFLMGWFGGDFPTIFGNTHIPGSSTYVKFLPFGSFFGEKAQILHTWKIQVYIRRNPLCQIFFYPTEFASLTSSEVHGADLNLLTEPSIASQGVFHRGGHDPMMASCSNNHGLPSRELTYPTWGKGKSSSKVPLVRDMLVLWRVVLKKTKKKKALEDEGGGDGRFEN